MKSSRLILVLLLLAAEVRADEQVRAVQEELRRRNIYFGDIDGRRTPELEQATKRYQQRKGFHASGTEDRDTLRSLGLLPRSPDEPPPKELEWPEEPVLKSDVRLDVAAEARQIGAETGVAPESLAPSKGAVNSKITASRRRTSGAKAPQNEGRRSARDQRLEAPEVKRLIEDYFKAVGRNDLRDELAFYGDRVDYYSNGNVDRRIIESSLRRYYQRWPSRSYSIGRDVNVTPVPSRGVIVVNCRVQFSLKNHGKKVRGQTDNRFIINAATADPRIVSIDERRVRL